MKKNERTRALEERKASMPELPEGFEAWVKKLYAGTSCLLYRRKGSFVELFCTACGEKCREKIKRADRYPEGMLERVMDPPIHNGACRCGKCGAEGRYKAAGKMRNDVWGIRKKCYVGQKYRTGIVVRYFEVEKIISKERKEEYLTTEIARNFFLPGEAWIKDYHLTDWTGKTDWYNRNIGGLYNITQEAGYICPDTYRELQGTRYAYTGLREYAEKNEKVRMGKYMEAYRKCPHLEMVVKTGLMGLADWLIETDGNNRERIIQDSRASRPSDLLGIWPERVKRLIRESGSVSLLGLLQTERDRGEHWPEDVLDLFDGINLDVEEIGTALQYMSARQFANRIEKYAGVRYQQEMCSRAAGAVRHIAGMYIDYLRMREERGYDLYHTVFAYPRDLRAAHDQMVTEINEERMKKKEQAEKEYPTIHKRYAELYRHYHYEADGMCIRPAGSAGEIIREGQILHHCVGSDNYLKGHNEGKRFILFLRREEDPDTPYVTVEIQGTEIRQWYGKLNRKPDEKRNTEWLKNYMKYLKRGAIRHGEAEKRAAG